MAKHSEKQYRSELEQPQSMAGIREINIDEIQFDNRNANKGTALGNDLLDSSISDYKIGRGVLVDKDLKLIAGNHAVQKIKDKGYKKVILVPTDGNTLVVTQRTDLVKDSKAGHELALADNRVSQANLSFDVDVIKELEAEFDLDLEGLAINFDIDTEDETDAADQMETYHAAGEDESEQSMKEVTQNLFPVMAALTKAQRLEFDRIKKFFDAASDTETILEMMKHFKL